MKIGILTGGGDVPGLNPCIKAVVGRAVEEGHDVVGIRRGWGGLLYIDRDAPETIEKYSLPLGSAPCAPSIAAAAPFCIPAAPIQAKSSLTTCPHS